MIEFYIGYELKKCNLNILYSEELEKFIAIQSKYYRHEKITDRLSKICETCDLLTKPMWTIEIHSACTKSKEVEVITMNKVENQIIFCRTVNKEDSIVEIGILNIMKNREKDK